jgi:hypothetical protein
MPAIKVMVFRAMATTNTMVEITRYKRLTIHLVISKSQLLLLKCLEVSMVEIGVCVSMVSLSMIQVEYENNWYSDVKS